MKKILFSATCFLLFAGPALSADLPSRKAPVLPPPPPPMWTGFYAGLNAGGTWANSSNRNTQAYGLPGNWDEIAAVNNGWAWAAAASAGPYGSGASNSGFIGGGQIGYNWQIGNVAGPGFGSGFVTGVEADIQGVAAGSSRRNVIGLGAYSEPVLLGPTSETSHDVTFATLGQQSSGLQYLGTVRGRLGFLAMPTLLVYGTGGLAYGGVTMNSAWTTIGAHRDTRLFNSGQSVAFGGISYSNTQVGWTAGGGLEWMFMPNWSAKAEYLFYDLGTASASGLAFSSYTNSGGSYTPWGYAATQSMRFNGNIVRAGVNYHFNWGAAPVVAKY
jgi:outer membrane immunogenic protein